MPLALYLLPLFLILEGLQWEGSPMGQEELDQNLGLLWVGGAGKAHLCGHGPPGRPAGSGGHAG